MTSNGSPIYGFYEEKYPFYSDVWENELQSPATAAEVNALVERCKEYEHTVVRLSGIITQQTLDITRMIRDHNDETLMLKEALKRARSD